MRAENFSMEKIPTTYENKTAETEAVTKKALSIFDSNNDGKLDAKEVKAANEQIKTSGWQAIADKIAVSVEQLKTYMETTLKTMGVDQIGYKQKSVENLDKSPHLPSKYHLENLKKRYPADKYDINYDKSNYLIEIKDKQGNLCLKIAGGEWNSHAELQEDDTLQCLPTIHEYKNGQLVTMTSYKNQQVHLIEKDFDEDGDAKYHKLHEYDKNGNLIKTTERIYEEAGLVKMIETEYNGEESYSKEYYLGIALAYRLMDFGINAKDINRICEENVLDVLSTYDSKKGSELIKDIVNNLDYSKKDKLKFIKHIGEQLIKVANSKDKDTRYIAEEFKIILEEQENEPIDATKLSNIIEKLFKFAKED